MNVKVTIGGQEFDAAPLKLKHIKEINKIVADKQANPKPAGYSNDIEPWIPFMLESLKACDQNVSVELLEDKMTLQEFNDAWTKIMANSSLAGTVQLVAKQESVH